jgi:uncharacterized protein Usg
MELVTPKLEIDGFGLTTASILYRLPDFPDLLQTFVWQRYDTAPRFPELLRFIDFWEREIEGALHSVTVAHHHLLAERDLRVIAARFSLN